VRFPPSGRATLGGAEHRIDIESSVDQFHGGVWDVDNIRLVEVVTRRCCTQKSGRK